MKQLGNCVCSFGQLVGSLLSLQVATARSQVLFDTLIDVVIEVLLNMLLDHAFSHVIGNMSTHAAP